MKKRKTFKNSYILISILVFFLGFNQANAQRQDDFWSGGAEKRQSPTSNNNKDFWSGTETTNQNSNFWTVTNNSSTGVKAINYKIRREGGYSWVEDEKGNMLIDKTIYEIISYKDGLAFVSIETGTDYDSELGDITLYESFYVNSKGEKLPPTRKTINFPPRAVLFSYHYNDTAEDKQKAIDDYKRRRSQAG